MIEKVEGFWLCDCGSLNPDEYGICLTPHCYAKKPSVSKHKNTDVMSIPMSTDKPKTSQKRDLTIGSGVSSANASKTSVLSASDLARSQFIPVMLPRKKKQAQKWQYKDMVLDSTTEKDRYLYLEKLEAQGVITDLIRPEAIEIRARLVIPANDIHPQFIQSREVYTPDFAYRYNGYFIVEDVKGKRWLKHKDDTKTLKPKLEKNVPNKIKRLQEIWVQHPKRVILLTVEHGGVWHYFNTNQNEIGFSLESQRNAA